MFDDIFGGGRRSAARRRGRDGGATQRGFDLETQVELTLAKSPPAREKTIEFEKQDNCDTLQRHRRKAGHLSRRLRAVRRAGPRRAAGLRRHVPHGHDLPQLPRQRDRSCKITARACGGTGRQLRKRVVTVKIPAGVHEGQAVRIAGEGEPGENGAPPGDLHCYIQ